MPRDLRQAIAFLLGLWLALQLSPLVVRVAEAGAASTAAHRDLETTLLEVVNATREQHHLIPLRRDPELDRVALAHAADMAQRGFLSHENPEGANPVDRLQRAGVSGFSLAAENIGKTNEADPNRRILESWLASPEHRRNLLTAPFNATGVAIVPTLDGSLVYTQVYVTYPR
jgi:uncharacterized protein YkwD